MSTNEQNKQEDVSTNGLAVSPPPELRFDDVVGFDEQKERLQETILATARHDEFGSFATNSAALYSRPGAGRRRMVQATVGELSEFNYQYARVSTLNRRHATTSEFLTSILQSARQHEPLVLLLDCFSDLERNAPLKELAETLTDARSNESRTVILASVPTKLVCRGDIGDLFRAFDVCLELEAPDIERREAILKHELQRARDRDLIQFDETLNFTQLAVETDEFGVPELRTVGRRIVRDARTDDSQTPETVSSARACELIRLIDDERIEQVRAQTSIESVETTDVTFDDIGGLSDVKQRLHELLELPLVWEEAYDTFDLSTHGGILLHGPPGNGKTLLARAVANEVDRTFISIAAPNLKNEYGHGVEERLRTVFETARRNAPSIVFFDEFDAIGHRRGDQSGKDEVTSTILTELDGISRRGDIIVVAATNRIQVMDDALLRPGRFEFVLPVTPPDEQEQAEIFDIHTESIPLDSSVSAAWFVSRLNSDTSGAKIAALCEHAVTNALQRTDNTHSVADIVVTRADFEWAFDVFERCRDATTATPSKDRMVQ